MKQAAGSAGRVHVLRLQPGEEVRGSLGSWAREQGVEAAAIISAVGSLSQAQLRYAGQEEASMTLGDLEVLSFSGTLSRHGVHIHLSVADRTGRMVGGHLLEGCVVRTTLELVIQEIDGVRMERAQDARTGYSELDPKSL